MAKIYYQLDRIESSVLPLFNRLESSLNQTSSKAHQTVVPYDFVQRGIWSNMIDTIDQIKGNVITLHNKIKRSQQIVKELNENFISDVNVAMIPEIDARERHLS